LLDDELSEVAGPREELLHVDKGSWLRRRIDARRHRGFFLFLGARVSVATND